MLAQKINGTWTPWNGERIDDILHPVNIEQLWPDEELSAIGLARVVRAEVPAGKRATNWTLVDVAGVPTETPTLEDIPVERRLVAKSLIVDRLYSTMKLDAALAALNAADTYTQQRWNTRDSIYADDPTALALLQAIGADPAVIFAAE